ncbi:MAG: HNH endonuclease [Okeania sp. SIO3B5]|uniref:RNA-guided endonuclease IscB n=1 Tax=Okeania sp. SIO3B5 TaxID=2607811 RepID=UPI0013FF2CFD|nr:RNA-guided endonuclease IscB [Okeania sp. SIO3B5]NEO54128.1 HNH endonuclease [Okeania sp. SIO3B5]
MSNTNYVFVIDTNKKPLQPCKPTVARRLLNSGKAAVWRRFPFTLILKKAVEIVVKTTLTLKIDPGSKFTGMALLEGNKVIWMLLIQHRGSLISEKLQKRSQRRRARRTKNLRYRKPGLPNKKKPEGWLAPSLVHRVETIMTWVKRLIKFCPVESISMELVSFDTQLIQNPEINGTEYQQGELAGYELREYLLEKWGRQCAYCRKTNTPLEIEHIHPKSKGGSDRVSNLTVACTKCNQIKSNQDVKDFLSGKPELLKRILTQARSPLKDAAAVNSTRWKLFNSLKTTGLEVTIGSGGQTKFNRRKQQLPKAHCIDAACVGEVNQLNFQTTQALVAICKGQGGRQKAAVNKYGYPIRYNPLKPIKGWNSGDLALNIETGEVGRVNPRSKSNSFNFTVPGQKAKSVHVSKLKVVHKKDGYTYTFCPQLSINV